MALNIRAYQPLDHPQVSFPEKISKSGSSTDALETGTPDDRKKFLEDWQRMIDKHLRHQNSKDTEQCPVISLRLVRELDTI